jgi:transposase
MRKIRDVLRLRAAGMSSRNIALSLSIGATTVVDFLQRARGGRGVLAAARGHDR